MENLLTIEEARQIVLKETRILGVEKIKILNGIGRVIAEDIISPFDMPPFRRSAMDGYAIRFEDLEFTNIFEVIDEIKAGEVKNIKYEREKCVSIMTGAKIPDCFDTVVKFEDTEEFFEDEKRKIRILKKIKKGENIAEKGEDFRKGDILIKKGSIVDSASIAIIAYCGIGEILVYKRPKVGIIATGDEIKKIGEELKEGEIYDCNSYSIYGLVLKYGGEGEILGIARDNKKSLKYYIKRGLNKDILILSGGVSEGKYDFVVDVFNEVGIEMKFWKVAVKPGKPTFFGKKDNCLIFGLPGYPVSAYINFENLIRPAILKMQGANNIERFKLCGILTEDVENKGDRDEFLRVIVKVENGENIVVPYKKQKSGTFTSITETNGILFLKKGGKIKKGEKVIVEIYR
ncbi:MAG: molybdopterin molybdotransferase MoeA [Candidatus Omnitrophica bacterium]|nr:molybdopterin molybdotransferase MoeA [Candidatus Omnitrophota bacterium]MCM8807309.1 molybdopterin molybdotransferase MoeA [Candidatus Omnitrophota bacterium]